MPEKQLNKTQKRLMRLLLKDIKDEDLRDIIIDVIGIEMANRSSHTFPIRKVRDVIDVVARNQEKEMK